MSTIKIIPYREELQDEFKTINQEWVEEFFSLEPFDIAQLENPQATILDRGGHILFADWEGEIVGTIGLAKVEDQTYELIKMGVKKSAQGKGVGLLLGKAILEKAKELGAQKVELYTHTKLEAALKIYRKLGFQDEVPEPGKYCRCNLKMVLSV
ncbi:GNAT family N-acetyltransferase [Algoriphagus sp.]|uniref:GNAT family N-acetyltransferase n=1 Tax=Algoriphagus sp. TaxID=1872435 RepID=UPI00261B4057|nr:GNAT family N-acetyltransferase [Algoriphagus sp.]